MGRYRPNMIDGVAGLALGGAPSGVATPPRRATRPLTASVFAGRNFLADAARTAPTPPMISEPEPATATLEDWRAYRRQVEPLAGRDPSMRLALAVAEAQIAKLRRRVQRLNEPPHSDAGNS